MELLEEKLKCQGWILADGATGTNYFNKGLEAGAPPELWSIQRPNEVKHLHSQFLDAGCDLILTNSFGGTTYRLKLHGAQKRVRELNKAAAEFAKEAVIQHFEETGDKKIVAGSMGPTGELFEPIGPLTKIEALNAFTEQAEALAEGGVDVLWLETISSLEEISAGVAAAMSTGLPVIASMTFDTAGKSMMGVSPSSYAKHTANMGVFALGANCGLGPAELIHSIQHMDATKGVYITAKANCGIPTYLDGEVNYPMNPEVMAAYAVFARDAGARIIGGCCGTTPAHIRAMRKALVATPKKDHIDLDKVQKTLGTPWPGVNFKRQNESRKRKRARKPGT